MRERRMETQNTAGSSTIPQRASGLQETKEAHINNRDGVITRDNERKTTHLKEWKHAHLEARGGGKRTTPRRTKEAEGGGGEEERRLKYHTVEKTPILPLLVIIQILVHLAKVKLLAHNSFVDVQNVIASRLEVGRGIVAWGNEYLRRGEIKYIDWKERTTVISSSIFNR